MADQSAEEKVKKVLDKISGLPTLPTMLNQINKLMMNPRTSAKEVAQLISSDPSITAKVLRVVNSSFYGFPNRITTITHAIVILGFNTVKSIVLSSSIFDVFKKGTGVSHFNRSEFWKHSIGTGAVARVVGKAAGYTALEELFIAGLVHDVGKIILDQYIHDNFEQILAKVASKNCLIREAEEETLGYNHADIGGWLFQKWNMSKGIVECTRFHHNPALASEHPKPVAVVHVSDVIARALRFGNGGDKKIPAISDAAWETLGISPDAMGNLVREGGEEIDKAKVFLDFIK